MDYAAYPRLEFRRKYWKLLGAEIFLADAATQHIVGFIKMKAWKLREDIRLYTDQSMQSEVLRITTRQIVDLGATYEVVDSATGQPICSLRRRAWKSAFVRDHWDIIDPVGLLIGAVQENSGFFALVRRWLSMASDLFDLIFMATKQSYTVTIGAEIAANVIHRRNPFVVKFLLDTVPTQIKSDPRIPIAATALLCIMDANKNS